MDILAAGVLGGCLITLHDGVRSPRRRDALAITAAAALAVLVWVDGWADAIAHVLSLMLYVALWALVSHWATVRRQSRDAEQAD